LDLFLILSGFLIGGIIEKKYREKNSISLKNILKFYKRRWFKTVSMYFIIVIICLVVSHFDIYYAKFFTWDFLVFLQNLTVGDINFLSHINSLPIIYIAFKYLKPHSATESLLLIPALFIFVYSFGFICYHWIEKSIMDLRDK
jgi:peptidoglycan/LPS O-acetylase OafA/YrhL